MFDTKKLVLRWFLMIIFFAIAYGAVSVVFNHIGAWFAFGYVFLLITLTIQFSKRIGKFLGVGNDEK